MTEIRLLYVTAKNADEARQLAQALLQERLVACANIIPGMESSYWWEGKIESAQECVLILKTQARHVAAVSERIRSLHSYSCPCILELSVESGNPAYLKWLAEESTPR